MKSIILASAVLLALILGQSARSGNGTLAVHILDVGQGDSILLVSPSGKQILVDGGPDLSALEHLGKLMPFFDRTIELLILSHPNADHLTAFPEILRRFTVEQVLFTGVDYPEEHYDAFLEELRKQNISILVPDPSLDISMGDGLTLDVVWPPKGIFGARMDEDEVNNTSIVIRAAFGTHSILLTGDMEEKEEKEVLASGADVRSEILKVAHHGSHTSSSTGFLLAVQPRLALVSAGRKNRYGHPHKDVMERYKHFGIPVRTTAEEGTISLVFSR